MNGSKVPYAVLEREGRLDPRTAGGGMAASTASRFSAA